MGWTLFPSHAKTSVGLLCFSAHADGRNPLWQAHSTSQGRLRGLEVTWIAQVLNTPIGFFHHTLVFRLLLLTNSWNGLSKWQRKPQTDSQDFQTASRLREPMAVNRSNISCLSITILSALHLSHFWKAVYKRVSVNIITLNFTEPMLWIECNFTIECENKWGVEMES